MEAGADDFLAKPLDRIELSVRLEVAQRILKATSRIQSLENVLTICAYTKKIKFPDDGWQTIEEFMRRHLGITLSHGIEPGYYENVLKPQIEQLKRSTARRTGRLISRGGERSQLAQFLLNGHLSWLTRSHKMLMDHVERKHVVEQRVLANQRNRVGVSPVIVEEAVHTVEIKQAGGLDFFR